MGSADRVIRFLIAVAIAALYFMGKIGGTLAIVLEIVAIAFFLTSIVGWCPLYAPFKLSTRGKSGG
jgi:Inner membrane protein YgaP-like, transmembrane domain